MVKPSEREFQKQQSRTVREGQVDNDGTFLVDNYGGLNLTSSTVNLPMEDSPDMLNIEIGVDGSLKKRSGSFVRNSVDGSTLGTLSTTYTLRSDKVLLVRKSGTSLSCYLIPSKSSLTEATLIKTFTNVWASTASTSKPTGVWTTETRARYIMCLASHVPIEFELDELEMVGDGDTTIDVPGDYTENWASTNTFALYGEDTVVSCTNVSHSSGTTTFTFSSNIPNNQTVSVVQVGWHWWAEAIKRTADQVYASTYRFNTSVQADANVEIPTEVRRGLEADSRTLDSLLAYGRKAMLLYQNNSGSASTFTYDQTPASSTEYAFSNQVYTSGAGNDNITPGTAYVTFGGIAGSGTNPPTPVHMVRLNWLPFNGGEKIAADELAVIDSTGFTWEARYNASSAANTVSNKYYWVLDDSLTVETTSTNEVQILTFAGGYPFGLDVEFVEIVNKEPGDFVGSSATSTYYSPKSAGSYRPWYGASVYANYRTGVFPSVIALYQDRLCLSGFSSSPLTVLFSNTKDNGSRWYYQNFQVDYEDTTLAYNPVEIVLDGYSDDEITGGLSWFNSFFLFTKKSTRRIHGGDNVAISPTNSFQNVISSVGCYSRHGYARTDRNVVFISNSGFYSIDILEQTGDYYTSNIGIKVEDLFIKSAANNPDYTWVLYNQLSDTLWVGIMDNDNYIPTRCLLLFNKRQAWGEYALHNGYFPCVGGCTDTFRVFMDIIIRDTDIDEQPSSNATLCFTEFNLDDCVTDLTYSPSSSTIGSGSESYSLHTRVQFTINTNQRVYSTLDLFQESGYSYHGFRFLPVADNDDYLKVRKYNTVYWEDKSLSDGNFTIITLNNSIKVLDFPWTTGNYLEITLLNDNGTMPIHVLRDNYELTPDTDYTISEGTNERIEVTLVSAGDADATYLVGSTIPCWHFTPTFFRLGNPTMKRGVHYIGYYDNRDYTDVFVASDVNDDAEQSAGEIVDQYKRRTGTKLGVLYNDSRRGVYESEVYGEEDLIWDISQFDFPSSSSRNQLNEVVRTSIPIIGVGYSIQCVNYNMSLRVFELIGYHLLTRQKGRNSTYWY